MKNIDFFEQEEIVKWLATNNRENKRILCRLWRGS